MPARRTTNASPVKNVLSEELLNHPLCVSERFGLSVHEYDGDEPVTVNSAHDSLSRVGQVKGALQADVNVIGVESDEKQYKRLFSEMNSWVAGSENGFEVILCQSEKFKKPSEPPAAAKADKKGDADVPTKPGMVIAVTEEGKCFSCEETATEDNPLEECTGCGKMFHEKWCMEENAEDNGDNAGIYCGGCKEEVFGEPAGNVPTFPCKKQYLYMYE